MYEAISAAGAKTVLKLKFKGKKLVNFLLWKIKRGDDEGVQLHCRNKLFNKTLTPNPIHSFIHE